MDPNSITHEGIHITFGKNAPKPVTNRKDAIARIVDRVVKRSNITSTTVGVTPKEVNAVIEEKAIKSIRRCTTSFNPSPINEVYEFYAFDRTVCDMCSVKHTVFGKKGNSRCILCTNLWDHLEVYEQMLNAVMGVMRDQDHKTVEGYLDATNAQIRDIIKNAEDKDTRYIVQQELKCYCFFKSMYTLLNLSRSKADTDIIPITTILMRPDIISMFLADFYPFATYRTSVIGESYKHLLIVCKGKLQDHNHTQIYENDIMFHIDLNIRDAKRFAKTITDVKYTHIIIRFDDIRSTLRMKYIRSCINIVINAYLSAIIEKKDQICIVGQTYPGTMKYIYRSDKRRHIVQHTTRTSEIDWDQIDLRCEIIRTKHSNIDRNISEYRNKRLFAGLEEDTKLKRFYEIDHSAVKREDDEDIAIIIKGLVRDRPKLPKTQEEAKDRAKQIAQNPVLNRVSSSRPPSYEEAKQHITEAGFEYVEYPIEIECFFKIIDRYLLVYYSTGIVKCIVCYKQSNTHSYGRCHKCAVDSDTSTWLHETVGEVIKSLNIDRIGNARTMTDLISRQLNFAVCSEDHVLNEYYRQQSRRRKYVLIQIRDICNNLLTGEDISASHQHYIDNMDGRKRKDHNFLFLCFLIEYRFTDYYTLLKFAMEYAFDDDDPAIRRKRYDFYFVISYGGKEIPVCVEIDDKSHDRPEALDSDVIKDLYCQDHGIKMFRIDIRQISKKKNKRDVHGFFLKKYSYFIDEFGTFLSSLN